MPASDSFTAMLRARAARHGDRIALIAHQPTDPAADESLTYADLDRVARGMAGFLRRRATPGDRVLLINESTTGFATAFLGCLYAGMIAVPVSAPHGYRRQKERLAAVARDAGARVALSDPADLATTGTWAADSGLRNLVCLAPEATALPDQADWTEPPPDARGLAFLQYTSGSTGSPKGVMVDHGNILANADLFAAMGRLTERTRFGGWLPMYHDFGLIGLLLIPLAKGCTTVLMPPSAFLRRPHRWLQMIHRYGVNLSTAPDFAYELCVRRVTDDQVEGLDLAGWTHAANGSEPIRPSTLKAFGDRFAAFGLPRTALLPAYGLAEATLAVSCTRPETGAVITPIDAGRLEKGEFMPADDAPAGDGPAGVRLLASSGVREPGTVVVDPGTRQVLTDGRVGEIWVRGPQVTRGYWGKEGETRRVFDATTAGGDGGYLRTGDLAVIWDGQLYVTGRIKEVLVVRGRNLYPQDIESEARTVHPALAGGAGAAFAVSVPSEEIVLVHECRTRDLGDLSPARLTEQIRFTLARELGVSLGGVVLLRPAAVQRTTSGKIQRAMMRDLFTTGALPAVHEDLSPPVRLRFRPGGPGPAGQEPR